MSSSADRTRQLAEQAPPSCSSSDAFPTTLLFLTDALIAFRAGEVAIRAFSARVKITTLTEKARLIFRVSNSSAAARRVYENWRPLDFSPPVHVLRYDHRPGVNKIVDARAIAKRASILVHKDFINLARKASWHPLDAHAPVVKPFKTRIQSFVTSGRVTPSSGSSSASLPTSKSKQPSVPWSCWVKNITKSRRSSTCGSSPTSSLPAISALTVGTNPTALFCEAKSDTSYCGFCGPPLKTLPPAPTRPLLARSLLPWLSDASLRPVTTR